jgi:hypothetical protein
MCDANAQIIVSPTQTMDFGQVHAGRAYNNPNFAPAVQNTGNAELTLTASISGPDAALFTLPGTGGDVYPMAVPGTGPCISGPTDGYSTVGVGVFFNAWSPVPKTCSATLTLSDSNAANASPGQTWVFPMTAQIILAPEDVTIEVAAPSFFFPILAGDTEVRELIITLVSQVTEFVSAIVRFPPPPTQGAFHWTAGDYIAGLAEPTVSVPVEFSPPAAGSFAQTLQLISNAQGSPFIVELYGTALEGFVP